MCLGDGLCRLTALLQFGIVTVSEFVAGAEETTLLTSPSAISAGEPGQEHWHSQVAHRENAENTAKIALPRSGRATMRR